MNTATETNDFASTLRSLSVDDMISIVFGKGGKSNTRTVRVSEIRETESGDLALHTTSGKVRPGRHTGGYIRLHADGTALFNATMAQQCQWVRSVEVLGMAN